MQPEELHMRYTSSCYFSSRLPVSRTQTADKINRIPAKDHRLVTRYLGGAVIQLNHRQRPGVGSHMTLEEVLKSRDIGDDIHLVSVNNTSTTTQATSPSEETRCI